MIAAYLLVGALVLLSIFQLALALGAPIGQFAWGGHHRVLPTKLRLGSLAGIGIYALIAVIVLDRAGRTSVFPLGFADIAIWVVLGYFVVGIGLNAASRSRPERYTMVPVTLVLAVLTLLVALEV